MATAACLLYANGYAILGTLGPKDIPIKTIVNNPTLYDGKNVTVIGVIGSRQTTTWMRSSITINDTEGFYIDLLNPIPSYLVYVVGTPYYITGKFTYYEYRPDGSAEDPIENGYGLIPYYIEMIYNTVH